MSVLPNGKRSRIPATFRAIERLRQEQGLSEIMAGVTCFGTVRKPDGWRSESGRRFAHGTLRGGEGREK
ncbi:hypothetical protein ASD85_25265 [Rhizobium sp. Root651]|nr:hypothetical protein ASD85_25265 [Rhizobium sp. Root651]